MQNRVARPNATCPNNASPTATVIHEGDQLLEALAIAAVRKSGLGRANHFADCVMGAAHDVRRRIDCVRLEVTGFVGDERPRSNRGRERVLSQVDGALVELIEAVQDVETWSERVKEALVEIRKEREALERLAGEQPKPEESTLDAAAEE